LAMSTIFSDSIHRQELSHIESLRYLQRKELTTEIEKKGWMLITFMGHPLGWVNVLQNRTNNYYPKELRILKDL
jgi:NOL1/NOP2/fmu family ribosome biogenesis protein